MLLATAVAVILISLGVLAVFYLPHGTEPGGQEEAFNTLTNFQKQMIGFARGGYAMDFATNDLTQIKNYLAQNHAPAYALTASLEKTPTTGCAVENWQSAKVSMVCFVTGKPLPNNWPGDLWLFVIDRSAIKDAPQITSPQIADINGITAAVWTQGDKLYLLGVAGDEQELRKYL